jgi:glycosyltransferase involved in cell wall biosynthesis
MPPIAERPVIADAPLSVILFAHNAAEHVRDVLAEWRTELKRRKRDYEILVVDDGSTDATAALVEEIHREEPRVLLLRQEVPSGWGSALRLALDGARHPLVCYCPCDRQYPVADLQQLLKTIDKVDLVLGCRAGKLPPVPWRVLGLLYRWLVRVLFGLPLERSECRPGWSNWWRRWQARWIFGLAVQDPECTFRLFRRDIFARIPIQSQGSFVHIEILAKANFLGCWMAEELVRYQPPENDRATGNLPESQFRDCWRLLQNPNFGPPVLTAGNETAAANGDLERGLANGTGVSDSDHS